MKPMIIIPPEVMSEDHMKILRDNGICVVVASEPSKVKFVDPIPAGSSRTQMENAAIRLSRTLLNWTVTDTDGRPSHSVSKGDVARFFVEFLVEGTPLSKNGTREDQEQEIIDRARREELYRIGQEEARAERTKKKAEKLAATKTESKQLPKVP